MIEHTFFIHGVPAPGGSKSAFPVRNRKTGALVLTNGRPVIAMVDAGGEANKRWKQAVKLQARSFMRGAKPYDCPIKVELIFFIQRPLKHFISGNRTRGLRPDAPRYHMYRPDALKYARSTEDGLTGALWLDDGQNVRLCTEKRWCNPGDQTGCAVRVVLICPQVVQPTLFPSPDEVHAH